MPFALPDFLTDTMAAFLLVFFRMTGVVLVAPLLSNQGLPPRIRVWFAFMLAAVAFPIVRGNTEEGAFAILFRSEVSTVLAVGSEIAIGWAIGWTASIMIYVAQLAGHLIGQEIGLAVGEVFDPVSQTAASPYANLYFTLGTLMFVVLNGHLALFEAVTRTFDVAPVGALLTITPATALLMAKEFGSEIYSLGVRLALPTILALLLATVSMAILARAVPEMNIFIVGFSIRIAIGLAVVVIMVPFVIEYMIELADLTGDFLADVTATMGKG
ncbi:MAG: flagellar biosynthetic protein FliR [Planctomycetota bacterium]